MVSDDEIRRVEKLQKLENEERELVNDIYDIKYGKVNYGLRALKYKKEILILLRHRLKKKRKQIKDYKEK